MREYWSETWRRLRAPTGWPRKTVRLLWLSGQDFFADDGPQWSAALSYYAVLSLFPLLLALASLAAAFVDPVWAVERSVTLLATFLPLGDRLIAETVRGALEAGGRVGALSILVLLWSGSRVFSTLTHALNAAYDVEEPYVLWKRLGLELAMVLSVGLLFVLALSSGFLLSLAWRLLGVLPHQRGFLFGLVKDVLPLGLLLFTFYLAYRYVPRTRTDHRAALAGSAVAVLLFALARPLFVYYLEKFARYNLIYGSLSIIIVLLVWIWLVAAIVLYGGEVASHVQRLWMEGAPEPNRD
jgi:membrane protein